jgi:hypothetical protein
MFSTGAWMKPLASTSRNSFFSQREKREKEKRRKGEKVWSGCIWRYHVLGTEGQGSQHYFVSMFSISVPFSHDQPGAWMKPLASTSRNSFFSQREKREKEKRRKGSFSPFLFFPFFSLGEKAIPRCTR